MHVGFLGVLQPVDVLGVLGPVDGTEGLELDERDVLQAGEFGEDAPGGVVQAFAFLHETAHQGPLSLRRFEVALEQQETQFPFLEPEDDAVHGGVELGMDAVVGLRGH